MKCPITKETCWREDCEWYDDSIEICGIFSLLTFNLEQELKKIRNTLKWR